ncbi:MAG: nicotinate (nicotinamide) nucleotide adenylyltransferase [Phycisphaeraceae bacterium]|nr:nicotinate (nicotinamide) nucleotide adenylyltransferase [Phycisphaeraceae bacterium]
MIEGAPLLLVYGGAFDPPHRAHVLLPRLAMRKVGAEGVVYVPTGVPPHKPGQRLTAGGHRLDMLRLALREQGWARIDTDELDRAEREDGPQYTVDTLERMARRYPAGTRLRLLIGADQMAAFESWRRPERVIELAEPVVMVRPPHTRESLLAGITDPGNPRMREAWAGRLIEGLPVLEDSASEIRRRLGEGLEAGEMLDPAVAAYIHRHGLYAPQPEST